MINYKRYIIYFALILLAIAIASSFMAVFSTSIRKTACADDAKICSDGSYATRNSSNNCEFNPCPDEENKVYCTPESRNIEACIQIYRPVCGWDDPEKIQCFKYPCAQTYGNNCEACVNEDVLYLTEGECPR